jgi:phage I-like protein
MPADFLKCIEDGGKVRTVSVGDNQYMRVCYLNGKSYNGEVMTKKETSENKISKLFSRIDIGKDFAEKQSKAPMSEIEVLTEGYWEHPEYGAIEITPEDIDKFVQNFDAKTRKIDIAVDQEHKPDLGAAGWFRELRKVVENGVTKLKAKIEWTAMGMDLLSKGIYKYFSPEFDFEYEDFETHDTFENVLLGGALTNRPYFKSLAPVQLSENVFISLDKKGGEIKMEEEKKPEEELEAKPEVKSEEQPVVETLAVEEKPAEEAEPEEAKPEEKSEEAENGEEKDEAKEFAEGDVCTLDDGTEGVWKGGKCMPKGMSEKMTETLPDAKEFNDLKSKIGVLEAKLRFKETVEEVSGYTFSESNPTGKLLPKSSDVAQKLLMSLSERQSKLFKDFMESLPKVSKVLFSEIGGDDGKSLEASEQLVVKANELAKEKGITFGQALKKVSADNPELAKNL